MILSLVLHMYMKFCLMTSEYSQGSFVTIRDVAPALQIYTLIYTVLLILNTQT